MLVGKVFITVGVVGLVSSALAKPVVSNKVANIVKLIACASCIAGAGAEGITAMKDLKPLPPKITEYPIYLGPAQEPVVNGRRVILKRKVDLPLRGRRHAEAMNRNLDNNDLNIEFD